MLCHTNFIYNYFIITHYVVSFCYFCMLTNYVIRWHPTASPVSHEIQKKYKRLFTLLYLLRNLLTFTEGSMQTQPLLVY